MYINYIVTSQARSINVPEITKMYSLIRCMPYATAMLSLRVLYITLRDYQSRLKCVEEANEYQRSIS